MPNVMIPTRIVKEQRIVGLGILDQPVHGTQEIGLGRLAHWILLVIGQEDHVFALVAVVLVEVVAHVLNIIDAPTQLSTLPKVVDSNEQSLAAAGAIGVLERVARGSTCAKRLGLLWRRRRSVRLTAIVVWGYGTLATENWGGAKNDCALRGPPYCCCCGGGAP